MSGMPKRESFPSRVHLKTELTEWMVWTGQGVFICQRMVSMLMLLGILITLSVGMIETPAQEIYLLQAY